MTSRGRFRWGNTMQLLWENPIKEYIISSNSLLFRKVKQCLHVVYSKTFYICDYFFFLTRNSQVTVSCFIRSLTEKLAHPSWPTLRWLPFQIAEFDLLEVTSYIDPIARIDECIGHLKPV